MTHFNQFWYQAGDKWMISKGVLQGNEMKGKGELEGKTCAGAKEGNELQSKTFHPIMCLIFEGE
jgi:hypothetical protein